MLLKSLKILSGSKLRNMIFYQKEEFHCFVAFSLPLMLMDYSWVLQYDRHGLSGEGLSHLQAISSILNIVNYVDIVRNIKILSI